ncbi:hypothetical protein MBOURGENBZM_14310 [Methanoculleus bourgensis]|nr:hypothetical protein MBOURGENBZM_14310 [Methanoculleus bourgensis]
MPMGRYVSGDVVLASVRIGGTGEWKVRPAVVVTAGENGSLLVCPVSSKPPSDTPSVPLSIDDFARGGLDLFQESYVLTAYPFTVRPAGVVAKKGSLLPETVAAIQGAVPAAHQPREKRSRRRR